MKHYDVVTATDFRLPGGTNHSTAQELSIQNRMGLVTGLTQASSSLSSRALPWSSMITAQLQSNRVVPMLPGEQFYAKLAILRHPTAILDIPSVSAWGQIEQALVIANQPAIKPSGAIEYDVSAVTRTVEERFGIKPQWSPIGPIVRSTLEPFSDAIDILPYDWTNVFSTSGVPTQRTQFNSILPRVGRHSRPQPAKWPNSFKDIYDAYLVNQNFDVRILGGAKPALDIIGRKPRNWTVHSFGSLEPSAFLDEIDFWVYFHHPDWSEAYGRAIMEALWSGAVVILPKYLEASYGSSAVYCKPGDVAKVIHEFQSGERSFLEQSAIGQAFAAKHSAELHVRRIQSLLSGRSTPGAPQPTHTTEPTVEALRPPRTRLETTLKPVLDRYYVTRRPRALFVTSNGAGMGHLTRMLGLARAAADKIEPIFFSMSQGVSVVSNAGFPYEYVPFNSAMQTKSALWHKYFEDRLRLAIEHYNAEIIVFDGTWPYRGMLDVLQSSGLLRVWMRRGMWKKTISSDQLSKAPQFDIVIEPGEHARSYDSGATRDDTNSMRVAPMTVLSQSEVLTRSQALEELGLQGDRKYALVTLGAGNINDVASTQADVLSAIQDMTGWEAILTKPPIANATGLESAKTISTFPLARYTRAFDFAVSAAGYNSFAEWTSGGLPCIWIPNLSTMTDDQDARARWSNDNGYGLRAVESDSVGIRQAVSTMCNDTTRLSFTRRLENLNHPNGASEAAEILAEAWEAHSNRRSQKW